MPIEIGREIPWDRLLKQIREAPPLEVPAVLGYAAPLILAEPGRLASRLQADDWIGVPQGEVALIALRLMGLDPRSPVPRHVGLVLARLLADPASNLVASLPDILRPDQEGIRLSAAVIFHIFQGEKLTREQTRLLGRAILVLRAHTEPDWSLLQDALARLAVYLAHALSEFIRHGYDPEIGNDVIALYEFAVAAIPRDDPAAPDLRWVYNVVLLQRFGSLHDPKDLDQAIAELRRALEILAVGDERRPVWQRGYALILLRRYHQFRETQDLEAAIDSYRQSVDGLPPNSQERAEAQCDLAVALGVRFDVHCELTDLEEALRHCEEAARFLPDRSVKWGKCYVESAGLLTSRFDALQDLADLHQAIANCKLAEATLAAEPEVLAACHLKWGDAASRLSHATHNPDWLDDAIEHYRTAAGTFARGSRDFAGSLMNLGIALRARFDARGTVDDLDRANDSYQVAFDCFPSGSYDAACCEMNWANALHMRFQAAGRVKDLIDALERMERAAPLLRRVPTAWTACQVNWGKALLDRYRLSHNLGDLDRALECFARVSEVFDRWRKLDGRAGAAIEWASCQTGWASALDTRHETTGDPADFEAAISRSAQAAEILPDGSPAAGLCHLNWANALVLRFQYHRVPSDLDQALRHVLKASDCLRTGSPSWSLVQSTAGNVFLLRYQVLENPADLDEALLHFANAIDSLPEGSLAWARAHASRARPLLSRFDHRKDPADLSSSLYHLSLAKRVFRPGSLDAGLCHLNAYGAYLRRYLVGLSTATDDLDVALDQLDQAAKSYSPGSLKWASVRVNTGFALRLRFLETGDPLDLEQALQQYTSAAAILQTNGALAEYCTALDGMAECHILANNLAEAHQVLTMVIDLLERRLVEQRTIEDQLRLIEHDQDNYKRIIWICLELAKEGDQSTWHRSAWSYVERSRARITLQTIARAAEAAPEDTESSERSRLLRQWAETERKLAGRYQTIAQRWGHGGTRLQAPFDPIAVQELEDELARCRRELAELAPDIDVLQPVTTHSLAEIQESLSGETLLIEFYTLQDRLLLFILGRDSFDLKEVPLSAATIDRLTRSFRRDGEREPDGSRLSHALDELGPILEPALSPHLARLPRPSPDAPEYAAHLILVPHGDLHFWPLHALPLGNGTQLLDHVAVSYLPAATALPMLAKLVPAPGLYHGFAPPVSPPLRFARPQVLIEGALLRRITTGTQVRFDGATREAAQGVRGGILSFATHARADLARPEHSTVQLSGPDGIVERVTALEFLAGLGGLRCMLLLLWGCETHGAGAQAGDNWTGITRAFLGAGRTVVASLWPIRDLATIVVSLEFSRNLAAGMTVPQALRWAILRLRDATVWDLWKWGKEIGNTLSTEERESFRDAWDEALGPALAPAIGEDELQAMIPQPEPLFRDVPGIWTPYVVIGWPGGLVSTTEAGDTSPAEEYRARGLDRTGENMRHI